VLIFPDDRGTEEPCNKGPTMVNSGGAMSKSDKMLLNCLEHVSHAKACYLVYPLAKLTVAFCLVCILYEGSNNGEIRRSG
jgi:hypothetical protein